LYDRLFAAPDPDALPEGRDFIAALNPDSLITLGGAKVEPSVADDPPGSRYQFERTGYFISDPVDSRPGALVFNRTVALRDSWAKVKDK
jgi:glutaminyl-tRNA synthetase